MTIDADITSDIERICESEGSGFDQVMNDLLREALTRRAESAWMSPIHPQDLGEAMIDVSSASRAMDYAEGRERPTVLPSV